MIALQQPRLVRRMILAGTYAGVFQHHQKFLAEALRFLGDDAALNSGAAHNDKEKMQ